VFSAQHLTRRLDAIGIRARPARNTGLNELAAELPAVVLARPLGLNITSAARWATRAAASNADYAATVASRGLTSGIPSPRPGNSGKNNDGFVGESSDS
jgi:hypothetical protein